MTEGAESPSIALGRQVKRWRERRGLSAQALAGRALELGATALTRAAISKIEVGKRGVSVDEWLQLAYALAVPPPLLLLDLESGNDVEITPRVVIHPWLAWEFIVGDEPPIATDRTVIRPAEHSDSLTVIRLYRRQREAVDRVHRAESAISAAEYAKDAAALSAARTQHADALRELAGVLGDMVDGNVQPPGMPPEWIKRMKRLKVLPDKVLAFEAESADG